MHQVSIVPRGWAGGFTLALPEKDVSYQTKKWMEEEIAVLLAGRVAEQLVLEDVSTGASNDIERASKLAKDMVARYGMSEKIGTVSYLDDGEVFIGRDYQSTKSYSEQVAGTIDQEVKTLIDRAYDQCRDILKKDSDKLQALADYLLANESITGQQFANLMEGKPLGEASTTSLTDGFEE